jgi:hypothetical protein
MPNPKGVVLTERDRVLLSYVGIARYASAEQVHRLFFEGRSKKQTYRRLAKLCRPGSRPGEGACLRRLEYRRREGTGVPVWALAPYGRSLVVPLVPWLRPPAASDIGARFLEHTLLLNDVLAELVMTLRASATAPLAALPFRWLSEDDGVLEFENLHRKTGTVMKSVLKPDAILEVPTRQRRIFVEAETGTQSIATAHPGRNGAVVSKLYRYDRFVSTRASGEDGTWYQRAFNDGFAPRLLFLVHSEERKERVQRATGRVLGSFPMSRLQVLVFTFAEAAGALRAYITEGAVTSPAPSRAARLVTMDRRKASQLREGYNELADAFNAMREAVKRHNATPGAVQVPITGVRMEAIRALRDFIQQEVSASDTATSSEGQPGGASHG